MKRLNNLYPICVEGQEFYVSFDHFTNGGQAVYNVEFLSETGRHMIRYSGVKAANQEEAARNAYRTNQGNFEARSNY